MLLVNNHILKMTAILKLSTKYNRRAMIIEDLRTGRSATEIIRFFGYPRLIVYDVIAKYTFQNSLIKVQYASEEELFERTHREDPRSR